MIPEKRQIRKRAEAAIQRALVVWLREHYPLVKIHATMNEDSRTQTTMGIDIGIPDLLIFHMKDGVEHIFYLELKTKTGALGKSQIHWHALYEKGRKASNNSYRVAYGLQQAKEACKEVLSC